MANAAFGEAVPTDGRNPERVADSILARLAITRRAATVADRAFACRTHHLAYRDVVERQFGAWVEEQQDGFFQSSWAATPHSLFFGSSSGFAKEMLGVRSRVKQRSPGMSGSDCRTTAEMSVRLKQHTTPDGPGTLWLLDGDVHAVNPPKLDPYERSQVAAKTRGRQCHLRCSVNRLCHASGIAG